QVIHNTLWIVGHFHQMALLGIGLAIIGATYAWLPELIGKPLYSEAMARWHVWLTFVFAMFNSAIWMYQGLLGGPRRFDVLPHRHDHAGQLAVPVSIVLAAAQILFAWNIVQTLRGKRRERDTLRSPRAIAVGLAALLAAAIGGWAAFGSTGSGPAATTTTASTLALPGKR